MIRFSTDWVKINQTPSGMLIFGLSIIDKILFAATNRNRLLRLDLHGLRQP
jgi:hypothetical protein